jgi:small nuclear ribonucleoprotein (snRNP)-like protein
MNSKQFIKAKGQIFNVAMFDVNKFIESLYGQRIIVKLRGAVISGVLVDSTYTGGLLLKDIEIIEDGRGRMALKDSLQYIKDMVFIRGDNVIAIMLDRVDSKDDRSSDRRDGGRGRST